MVLVRFIVVFVWEAFALWSHLLKHIAHPLECIMEMKSLLLCFFNTSLDMTSCFFMFFFYTEGRERGGEGGSEKAEKKKKVCGSLFKVRSDWNL